MVNTENYLTHPIQWIENEIYVGGKVKDGYIFKAFSTGGHNGYIYQEISFHTSVDNNYQWEDYSVRLATSEEKQWFLACESAGKFVPKPEYSSLEQIIIW